jgi:D-lyxose ketol-isomerase
VKRSEINAVIRSADEFIRSQHFFLPPFAYWTPETWATKGEEAREIVEHKLGWDITDFGQGDYQETGLFMFTIRNGSPENLKKGEGKVYAEKLLIVDVGQVTPFHFHWRKTEDIINRGGGKLLIQVFNATAEEQLDHESTVHISTDGVLRHLNPGDVIELDRGESVTLVPYCYHKFWGEGERVLVGEVSSVNDDDTDNRFNQKIGRFPDIEEDEPPLYLLVNDYGRYYRG